MSEWRPIKTAPRDGRSILATWIKDPLHIEAVEWSESHWSYSYDGDTPTYQPTHWMPLPEPPEEKV